MRFASRRQKAWVLSCAWLSLVLVMIGAANPAAAFQVPEGPDETPAHEQDDGLVVQLAPPADFHPRYLADPRRATSAVLLMGNVSSNIPDAGERRYGIRLGNRFGLLRVHPAGDPERGLQLDFEGGFFCHFDREHNLDNIGWDGIFGLVATFKPSRSFSLRFGTLHDSAHVGDEYAERTGRRRVDYTREELVLGAGWNPDQRWRLYSEAGWAYTLRDEELQRPWRLQAGAELRSLRRFWRGRLNWYAAADIAVTEERDWRTSVTVQLGVELPVGNRGSAYRFGLEYFDGRSPMGEFFFHNESYLALGWFFDF